MIRKIYIHDGKEVGRLELPESSLPCVILDPPWDSVAKAINDDIRAGKYLLARDRTFHIITGCTELEQSVVIHCIEVLSERRLIVEGTWRFTLLADIDFGWQ